MRFDVLDHGYVELVEAWGSDETVIAAARMSTDKGFLGWGPKRRCSSCGASEPQGDHCPKHPCPPGQHDAGHTIEEMPGDEKLLRFLWENKHATPFEMAGLIVEVQAPIFVFREWHRHRTQSYNELSARYTPLPDLFYLPSIERVIAGRQSQKNKQGSEGGFTETEARRVRDDLADAYRGARQRYELLLADGVARELARLVVPVAQYSRMRASANLRNWLAFLTLRLAPNAQWEIRQYAEQVGNLVCEKFPRTWELFTA